MNEVDCTFDDNDVGNVDDDDGTFELTRFELDKFNDEFDVFNVKLDNELWQFVLFSWWWIKLSFDGDVDGVCCFGTLRLEWPAEAAKPAAADNISIDIILSKNN